MAYYGAWLTTILMNYFPRKQEVFYFRVPEIKIW